MNHRFCHEYLPLNIFQHSDHYLLHHFVFEANESVQCNGFFGNFTLLKYMSLNDWQMIYERLRDDIASYTGNPCVQPASKQMALRAMNVQLEIRWIAMSDMYRAFVPNTQISAVFPYVHCVVVTSRSGAAEFTGSAKCDDARETIQSDVPGESADRLPELRKCLVRLPKLTLTNRPSVNASRFSYSSTPLTRHASNSVIPIESDVSVISTADRTQSGHDETQNIPNSRKRLFDQITATPSSQVTRSARKKRKIRLSPSQHLQSARKIRRKQLNKTAKPVRTPKAKRTVKKQAKKKAETIVAIEHAADTMATDTLDIADEPSQGWSFETMVMDDVLTTFDGCRAHLTKLFNDYLKQTDENVRKAGDYNPMDVMSMISHDQFGAMADVLYENFTPIGDINVSHFRQWEQKKTRHFYELNKTRSF